MKTILRPADPPKAEEVEITCHSDGGLVHLHVVSDKPRRTDLSFEAGEAVKLWRCLTGEYGMARPGDVRGDTYKLWYHFDPAEGDVWEFTGGAGKRLFFRIDADQAMALAWAIKGCCASALHGWTDMATLPARVWVLASKLMLTGDCAENGAEQLGGTERVFATERAARDALREFLRPLVNDCHTETYWESDSRTVDDVLDDILDDHCTDDTPHGDHWSYDGTKQSFEVTLSEVEVEHGA